MKRIIIGLSCVVALAWLSACFKSSTLEESSDSSSTSSSSSSGNDKEHAYQRDIRDYTATYAAKGGDMDRFRRDVAAIAQDHGVSDWEADPATLVAIGSGVRNAGLEKHRAQEFVATIAAGSSERRDWLQQGYDSRVP